MIKRIIFGISILVLIGLAPACGDDNITQSGGEYYEEYFDAVCERAIECGLIDADQEECIDVLVQVACSEDAAFCGREVTVSADEWSACLQGERELSCNSAEAGIVASECLTIDELF